MERIEQGGGAGCWRKGAASMAREERLLVKRTKVIARKGACWEACFFEI